MVIVYSNNIEMKVQVWCKYEILIFWRPIYIQNLAQMLPYQRSGGLLAEHSQSGEAFDSVESQPQSCCPAPGGEAPYHSWSGEDGWLLLEWQVENVTWMFDIIY